MPGRLERILLPRQPGWPAPRRPTRSSVVSRRRPEFRRRAGQPDPSRECCDSSAWAPAADERLAAAAADRAGRQSSGNPWAVRPRHVVAGVDLGSSEPPRGHRPRAVRSAPVAGAKHCGSADTTPFGCRARSTVSRTGSRAGSRSQTSQDVPGSGRSPTVQVRAIRVNRERLRPTTTTPPQHPHNTPAPQRPEHRTPNTERRTSNVEHRSSKWHAVPIAGWDDTAISGLSTASTGLSTSLSPREDSLKSQYPTNA